MKRSNSLVELLGCNECVFYDGCICLYEGKCQNLKDLEDEKKFDEKMEEQLNAGKMV